MDFHEAPIIGDKLHPARLDPRPNSKLFEFVSERAFETWSDLCKTSSCHGVIRFRSTE